MKIKRKKKGKKKKIPHSATNTTRQLVPGGLGTRAPASSLAPYVSFIASRFPSLTYLITICTGAGLAARAGVLDGLAATTNKRAWNATTALGPNVAWVPHARWVRADGGKVWTSSGVSAGIDATLAWMADVYGEAVADDVSVGMEYTRVRDWRDDPWAGYYGL